MWRLRPLSPKLSPIFCTGLLFCTFYVILICLVCLVIVFSWICLEEIRQEVFGIIWFIQFVSHFPSTYSPSNVLSHFFMRSPCTHSALTAMLLPCVHLRSLLCSILAHCSSCVYIVFTYHSPWLHFSLAFALCLHSVFVQHFLFISVHQILFSMCSPFAHYALTIQSPFKWESRTFQGL